MVGGGGGDEEVESGVEGMGNGMREKGVVRPKVERMCTHHGDEIVSHGHAVVGARMG